MSDRELLELAAKAAGVNWQNWTPMAGDGYEVWPYDWNPLTDDGDALRLAVRLGIGLGFEQEELKVSAYQHHPHDDYFVEYADDQEPSTATRRAIVRAAAEIGRAA